MKTATLFALLALLPAAANAGVPRSPAFVALACGGGDGRTIAVPWRPGAPARDDGQPCCAKGCHVGSSRKRFVCAC